MSLLITHLDENMEKIAKAVYDNHFAIDKKLSLEYDQRRKRMMYEDIVYNLGYLDTAIFFKDGNIFKNYAGWIFNLLCNLMPDIGKDRIKSQMITHYELLKTSICTVLDEENAEMAAIFIDSAIDATNNFSFDDLYGDEFLSGKYEDVKSEYLSLLMANKSRDAIQFIKNSNNEIPLETLYDDVLKNVMYRVGDLWFKNEITVDKEHYCTSTTQVALSQFYDKIFSSPRKDKTIITCCIGSELHEMGIRMLSDIFEYNGWDSFYLGSAVPLSAILHGIENYNPMIIGISVTMPHHLKNCFETVKAIREKFGDKVKIMVGGRAFTLTDNVWEKWPVDFYSKNANDAVKWAETLNL